MIKRVTDFITEYGMLKDCAVAIIGLSGGADSVCLLHIMWEISKKTGLRLIPVHVHHKIRGDEADRDRDFCRKICADLSLGLLEIYEDVPKYAAENGLSEEEAGRILRYKAFNETAQKYDGRIFVAHHINDSVETTIFNACRGSGIRGICGISPVNGIVCRPLICVTREEIEAYLEDAGLEYIYDSTNNSQEYTRNRIRKQALSWLCENVNSASVKNIFELSQRAREQEEYFERELLKYDYLIKEEKNGYLLTEEMGLDPYIVKRLVMKTASKASEFGGKNITATQLSAVQALFDKESGASTALPFGITATRNSDGVFFGKNTSFEAKELKVTVPMQADIDNYFVKVSMIDKAQVPNLEYNHYTKYFDYDKIKSDLLIRTGKAGDYLTIDKEGHRKSLGDYLKDIKMPARKRADCLVLADGAHVMWVLGERISEYYKIDTKTDRVLKVEYGGLNNGES